ncbi:MAG: EAL domain-containing protein [Ketobacteraceae bacterium]|nr:EAL domain-containing protein [Ketobacteraceae bacterium]
MFWKLRAKALAGFAFFVCIGFAVGFAQADSDLKPVTVQLKWKHQFQFAGFYAAIENGYYRDIGLDVTLKEAGPGTNPVEEVIKGNADYGVANAELLLYRMIGEPVTALAAIFQHSPLVIITLRESGITTPQDLIGKRVMFPEGPYGANTLGVLLKEGVDPSQVQQVPLSFNLEDLVSGNVDAMVGYITDKPYMLKERGISFQVIDPAVYGVDFYGDTLFTTEERSVEQFDEVKAFREATLKGWRYALSHQAELVDLIREKYTTSYSRDQLLYEARETAELIMPQLVDLGHMNPDRWEHIAETFRQLHLVGGSFDREAFVFDPANRAMSSEFRFWRKVFLAVVAGAVGFIVLLSAFNSRLKKRVQEQTAHLEEANQFLVHQTNELIAAESRVSELNRDLENRVLERTEDLFRANEELKSEVSLRRERELSLQLLSSALENISGLVVIIDYKGFVTYVNLAFRDFTGQLSASLEGCELEDLEGYFQFPTVDHEDFLSYVKTKRKIEICGHDSGGKSHWFQTTISPIFTRDKVPTHYVIVCEDVTVMKQRQDQMERLAFYDPLTGLENRVLFKQNIQKLMDIVKRDQQKAALLFIDLDHFKAINDTHGHGTGDIVLKTVADRIRSQVRDSDSVARISGDEFSVLLRDIASPRDVARIAGYILEETIKPISYQGNDHYVSASIGISITPDDTILTDDLIRFADMAMYKAKRKGRNSFHFYQDLTQEQITDSEKMANSIRGSLDESEFLFEFQPQICLKSNEVKAVEALLRWNRHDGRVHMPDEFLEIAERDDLVVAMGQWIVNEIEKTREALALAGMTGVKVAVNLSAKQFRDERFTMILAEVAKAHPEHVGHMQIEVKEKSLFEEPEESLQKLKQFRELGYSIAIDDFGVGYLSVSYLRQFPVDTIKIDKSLISRLPTDVEAVEVTLALIALAHKLNIKVVAEGVESEEQLRFLRNNGCDLAQGFYFSEAVGLSELISQRSRLH